MKKILVVEDNKSVLALLVGQLQIAGFEVHGVPDAMLGRRECIQWKPDLMILDLMLPAGGGISVLRGIRQSVITKYTPVIVLTGSDDAAIRKSILEFGVNVFLKKPHDPKELLEFVHLALHTEKDA